jgi:alpha-methylacyl-CoA racemase
MGPLHGTRIIELAGIGPAPMAAMLLAEMGADVIRVDRTADAGLGIGMDNRFRLLERSRRSVAVDLKSEAGRELVLELVADADALVEGFRPGVTERLGLGPDECAARNPRLVYGRVTGWGQDGTLSQAAGHDLNYIALTGALASIGRADSKPTPPLNLVGDFGGGALYLALGVVSAMFEAKSSGKGQTVDAAMVDGAASLLTSTYGMRAAGLWGQPRGHNILDSGAHFYEVYETSDGKHISLAPIEGKFYAEMLRLMGLSKDDLPQSRDAADWPALKGKLANIIAGQSLEHWCNLFEGTDVCFAPVLDFDDAPRHPHNTSRNTFVERDGVVQPNAAPRFSRTPSQIRSGPASPGQHSAEVLADCGVTEERVKQLMESGVIR